MLEVDSIDVFYGPFQALWGVSFRVNEGELVAIIGPNSAGKSTILRTISGILRPRTGSIKLFDIRLDKTPAYKICELGAAHVPEGRRIFTGMTVLENLEMGAYSKRALAKVHDTLEFVYQLFPVLKKRSRQIAGTLSGGEQQMLAIGRALMSRPKLFMLDESSLGLSPLYVKEISKTIKQLNDEGVTVLLVEQNVWTALELADRAYVIESGKIIMEGLSQDLLKDEHVKEAYLGI